MEYTFPNFKTHVAALSIVHSQTGIAYRIVEVSDNKITIFRESTKEMTTINTSELYEYYKNAKLYNTSEAKMYISTRAQSPAVAILLALRGK